MSDDDLQERLKHLEWTVSAMNATLSAHVAREEAVQGDLIAKVELMHATFLRVDGGLRAAGLLIAALAGLGGAVVWVKEMFK